MDIICDIIKIMISYIHIMYMKHDAPGFLVPLISPKTHDIVWDIGKKMI